MVLYLRVYFDLIQVAFRVKVMKDPRKIAEQKELTGILQAVS